MTSVKNMLPRYIFGHHPHDSPPGLSRWHALRCCLSSSLVPSGAYGENRHNFRWRHWDQQKSPRSKKVWRNLNLQWNSWFGNSTFIYPEGWIFGASFFRPLFSHTKFRWKSTASTASNFDHTFIVQLMVHASVKMDGMSKNLTCFFQNGGVVPFSGEPYVTPRGKNEHDWLENPPFESMYFLSKIGIFQCDVSFQVVWALGGKKWSFRNFH